MWRWATLAAAVCLLTGAEPLPDAGSVLVRVAPILVFLTGVTVVAEVADRAGVFAVAAHRAAGLGRGSTWRLWSLVVLLAAAATTVLSLDTTAVLLTPVVLALAAALDLPPLPFAMTTVWLANAGSLLLPVSNLTNLLAAPLLAPGATGYVRLAAAPALVCLAVTVGVLAVRHRRALAGSYALPAPPPVTDRPLLLLATGVCLALGPLFVSGVPVWATAAAAAAVLVVAAAGGVAGMSDPRWSRGACWSSSSACSSSWVPWARTA